VKKENEVTYGALEEVDAEEVSGGDGGGERAAGEGEHGVRRARRGGRGRLVVAPAADGGNSSPSAPIF
jgi:hypothetical protein